MSVYLTPHFSVAEMACKDGTPYPINEVDEEDPEKRPWMITRLLPLFDTLEVIRSMCGKPLIITSGYRTLAYDERLYNADRDHNGNKAPPQGSQHPKGRAADIICQSLTSTQLRDLIGALYRAGKLPHLGGLGWYPSFVHVDVRPRVNDHLAQWGGTRLSNIA